MKKKSPYQLGQVKSDGWVASYDFASLYPRTMPRPKIHKKILRSSKINEIWKKIKE
jgi:hypothetical protein